MSKSKAGDDILEAALSNVRFLKPRSAQVYKAAAVVVVNDHGSRAMVVRLADGRIITSATKFDSRWAWLRRNFWAAAHQKALVALGALTHDQIALFAQAAEAEEAEENLRYAAKDLEGALNAAGLKATPEQKRFIAKHNAKKP